jgi:hypothetical protein
MGLGNYFKQGGFAVALFTNNYRFVGLVKRERKIANNNARVFFMSNA